MTKAIKTLTKDIESQNNEKFQLNSTKRLFDTQNTERRNADHNLQMVITGFKASVNVNEDHADSRALIDTLKAHMNATKNTPLVGQELVGIQDGQAVKLHINLSKDMLQKLGRFLPNYDTCVQAQERYNEANSQYANTEKEYGNMDSITAKLAKVQNNIDTFTQRIEQIRTAFQSLDSEFTDYMQDQKSNDIQVLKSTSCDNKPLMETSQINHLTDVLLKGQQNVESLFTQNFDVNFISRVIKEVTHEMQIISKKLVEFQKVEILDTCMKVLHQDLYEANTLYKNESAKIMQNLSTIQRLGIQ